MLETKQGKTKKLTIFLIIILGFLVLILMLGFYFFDKIEIGKSYDGDPYIIIRLSNTKPYKELSCNFKAGCNSGEVYENADTIVGSPTPTKNPEINYEDLLERCGDIPYEDLNLPKGHYEIVNGPKWAPDCRHIAYSVFNSGTVAINPDGTGTGVSGQANEGIFIYNNSTKQLKKLFIQKPFNENYIFEGWKNGNILVISYNTNTNKGRDEIFFDTTTNKILPK